MKLGHYQKSEIIMRKVSNNKAYQGLWLGQVNQIMAVTPYAHIKKFQEMPLVVRGGYEAEIKTMLIRIRRKKFNLGYLRNEITITMPGEFLRLIKNREMNAFFYARATNDNPNKGILNPWWLLNVNIIAEHMGEEVIENILKNKSNSWVTNDDGKKFRTFSLGSDIPWTAVIDSFDKRAAEERDNMSRL